MVLFQNAVLNKYLTGVDEKKVEEAWGKFTAHFHNAEVQENIRNSKEEAYQEGFLDDLFVKVLGYTKNPSPDYNLMVEQKNITDSKKSDGALLDGDKVRGVIELKGTETTDLGKVETQAFGYKNKQPDAIYVIISNFEKLRFYIDNAVDFLEFNLFRLTKEEFKVLWLCLGYPNFAKGLPKKIKDASLTEEENITKKLYKDYFDFKHAVFESMKEHNPEYDKLLLFKKTQKLLDRFLFILFAEDRLLLPPNSIREIINQWMDLRDKYDEYVPLYDRFKKYFGYMNEGHKGKNHEIFAYNGGLFAEDEVLDDLNIEDEILYKYTQELSKYDFESEVDVNILGHIFEHSLNEIEEINAELKGEKVDSSKTRRKKDGIFYTPKYITKYIVEHTAGKLCEEKKAELDIVDERFTEAGRRSQKGVSDLKKYREWLLDLTICDPACGSGAFLNQALEFLIAEHKYIDELQARYHGEALVLSDIETQILENNLFGVDINEESVEIAKLSLWLRTAQKGRKLTSLNNNIKCGNSLIDDPEVAGEKTFKWEEEFPDIFRQKDKQAFHVTFVTHNSRTSQRMKDYKVKKGESFRLDDELEVFVTKTIADIVREDDLNVPAYNICADHVHMILVCEPEELPNIVRKLKGKSAQKLKEHLEITKEEKFHLWAQKFNRKLIEDEEALYNTWNYIIHNREKHDLPENRKLQEHDKGLPSIDKGLPDTGKGLHETGKGLQPLVSAGGSSPERGAFGFFGMCCSFEYAFRPEYSGGFDVVIGNPPYGILIDDISRQHFEENFPLTSYKINLYVLFIERMMQVFSRGVIHFIIPKSLLFNSYYEDIRKHLIENTEIKEIFTITEKVFQDAEVGSSLLLKFIIHDNPDVSNITRLATAETVDNFVTKQGLIENRKPQNSFLKVPKNEIAIVSSEVESILDKLHKLNPVESYYSFKNGLNPGNIKHILISEKKESDNHKPIIWGKNISRYHINWSGDFVDYNENIDEDISVDDVKSKKGMNKQKRIDFALRLPDLFEREKIVIRKTGDSLIATLDENQFYFDTLVHGIYQEKDKFPLKYLLGILNSNPATQFYRMLHDIKGKTFAKISLTNLRSFPIPEANKKEQKKISDLVDRQMDLMKSFYDIEIKFQDILLVKFDIEKLSRKLQSWHELTFKQFLKELKKKKVKLYLEEEAEWMEYFNKQKAETDKLKDQITQTDAKIDAMVYELYGLSEEEIEVVEGS